VLKTFTIREEPCAAQEYEAELRFDHPLRFLDYQGELKNAAGYVQRWDRGEYGALEWREDFIELDCRGRKWKCRVTLKKTTPDKWLLKKHSQKERH